jgi:hypothetical protein
MEFSLYPQAQPSAEWSPGLVGGVFADRRLCGRSMNRELLRFHDAAPRPDAEASAGDISAELGSYLKGGAQATAFIPGHPETHATQSPHPGGLYQVTGLTAHGPFVPYQEAQSPENAEAAAALAGKTIDLHAPRIHQYHPSDPTQPQSLDPTGLVAKTIPSPKTGNINVRGFYGDLHFTAARPRSAIPRPRASPRWVGGWCSPRSSNLLTSPSRFQRSTAAARKVNSARPRERSRQEALTVPNVDHRTDTQLLDCAQLRAQAVLRRDLRPFEQGQQ